MAESLIRPFLGAGTGSDQSIYTVPGSGVLAVDLRTVHIVNNDNAASHTIRMSIGADGAGTRIIPANFPVAPLEIVDLDVHITLLPGDVLHQTAESQLTVTVSGIQIS